MSKRQSTEIHRDTKEAKCAKHTKKEKWVNLYGTKIGLFSYKDGKRIETLLPATKSLVWLLPHTEPLSPNVPGQVDVNGYLIKTTTLHPQDEASKRLKNFDKYMKMDPHPNIIVPIHIGRSIPPQYRGKVYSLPLNETWCQPLGEQAYPTSDTLVEHIRVPC